MYLLGRLSKISLSAFSSGARMRSNGGNAAECSSPERGVAQAPQPNEFRIVGNCSVCNLNYTRSGTKQFLEAWPGRRGGRLVSVNGLGDSWLASAWHLGVLLRPDTTEQFFQQKLVAVVLVQSLELHKVQRVRYGSAVFRLAVIPALFPLVAAGLTCAGLLGLCLL